MLCIAHTLQAFGCRLVGLTDQEFVIEVEEWFATRAEMIEQEIVPVGQIAVAAANRVLGAPLAKICLEAVHAW
jgi:hypothetical protein